MDGARGDCFTFFLADYWRLPKTFKYFKPALRSMVRVVTCHLTTNVACTETPKIDLKISCFGSLELVKKLLEVIIV